MPVSDKVRGFMEEGGWIRRMFEVGTQRIRPFLGQPRCGAS